MEIFLTNPTLPAAGAAAAFAPLILHLWLRSRYRTIDWGATMFFPPVSSADGQGLRLRQWTLLGLRMLTIALLGAALARPIVALRSEHAAAASPIASSAHSASVGAGPGGAATVVLLIDRSASMSLDEQGRGRMSLAQDAANQILQLLLDRHRGDRAAVIALGTAPDESPAAPPMPTSDLSDAQRRVAELTPVDAAADVASGLREAIGVLAHADTPARSIYLICDRQAVNWNGIDASFAAAWRLLTSQVAAEPSAWGNPPALYVVPIGASEANAPGNVFVASMRLDGPPPVVQVPTAITIDVKNSGAMGRSGVPFAMTVVEESGHRATFAQTTLRLGADADDPIRVPLMFDEAGSRLLEADVWAAGMPFDKRLDFALNVNPPLSVLLLTSAAEDETSAGPSAPSTQPSEAPAQYVQMALAPFHGHRNPAIVQVQAADRWMADDLDKYQVIVLDGVPNISASQAAALEKYVYDGGGLVVAPGNASSLENYNQRLYRDGSGILPALLGETSAADEDAPATASSSTAPAGQNSVTWVDLASPVFEFLAGRADALPPASVWRYVSARLRPADGSGSIDLPPPRVLGRYADGSAFLIEGRAGRGRVLLLTSALDPGWNDLPLTNFFLPFVQSLVEEAAAGQADNCNVAPGQELTATFREPIKPGSMQLLLPDDRVADASTFALTPIGDRLQFRYGRTQVPGVYRLHYTTRQIIAPENPAPASAAATASELRVIETHRTQYFVVQPLRDESDVTPLSPGRWRELQSMLGFQRIDADQASLKASLTAQSRRGRYDLWLWLLLAMLLVSGVELFLSRAWSAEAEAAGVESAVAT